MSRLLPAVVTAAVINAIRAVLSDDALADVRDGLRRLVREAVRDELRAAAAIAPPLDDEG